MPTGPHLPGPQLTEQVHAERTQITAALEQLRERSLVQTEDDGKITLTAEGRQDYERLVAAAPTPTNSSPAGTRPARRAPAATREAPTGSRQRAPQHPHTPSRRRRHAESIRLPQQARRHLSTRAFIDYYEIHHVPLVLSLAATPVVYKRNYLLRGDKFNRETDAIDFDVVTELVFPDREAFVAWIEDLSHEAISTDDETFLDRSRTSAYVLEEHATDR